MSKRERIEALEARVAALEASNSPGGLEDAPDNTPGGDMCEAAHTSGLACTLDLDHDGQHVATGGPGMVLQTWTDPEPVCRACGGSGYADYAAVPCPACETVPPEAEPVPQWRAMVETGEAAIWWGDGAISAGHALSRVLHDTATLASGEGGWQIRTLALARIVAVCEGQVGDGWKADPGRVPHGHWGIAWLLAPLSHEPPDWVVAADRSAAWLRSLLDGAA